MSGGDPGRVIQRWRAGQPPEPEETVQIRHRWGELPQGRRERLQSRSPLLLLTGGLEDDVWILSPHIPMTFLSADAALEISYKEV